MQAPGRTSTPVEGFATPEIVLIRYHMHDVRQAVHHIVGDAMASTSSDFMVLQLRGRKRMIWNMASRAAVK